MSIPTDSPIVRGKWGFYSCDAGTFRKLRRLNFLALHARIVEATWHRWNRKLPQNRVCKTTVRDEQGRAIRREVRLDETGRPICIPEPRRPIDMERVGFSDVADLIAFDYRNARRPHKSEVEVEPLRLTREQIDTQLARYERWNE